MLLQRLAGSGSSTQDLAACAADGEGCCGPGAGELGNSGGSARSTGGPAGVGLAGALRSPVPAAQHPLLQRAADSSAQEGDDGNSVSDCSTGSISLEVVEPLVSLDELATPEAPAAAAAAPAEQQEGRTPAAVVGAEPAAAEATPVRAAQPQQREARCGGQRTAIWQSARLHWWIGMRQLSACAGAGTSTPMVATLQSSLCHPTLRVRLLQRPAPSHGAALLPARSPLDQLRAAQPAGQAAQGGPLHLWRGRGRQRGCRRRQPGARPHQAAPAVPCSPAWRRRGNAAASGRLSHAHALQR